MSRLVRTASFIMPQTILATIVLQHALLVLAPLTDAHNAVSVTYCISTMIHASATAQMAMSKTQVKTYACSAQTTAKLV